MFSLQLREKLFAAIENQGFGLEKQAELMGRAATELALQLLGGQHRYRQCLDSDPEPQVFSLPKSYKLENLLLYITNGVMLPVLTDHFFIFYLFSVGGGGVGAFSDPDPRIRIELETLGSGTKMTLLSPATCFGRWEIYGDKIEISPVYFLIGIQWAI